MYGKDFTPGPRGGLQRALETPRGMQHVRPESPRPYEMLSGVSVKSLVGQELTALDQSLHEALVSHAHEDDPDMKRDCYTMPMKSAVRYLGEHARRDDVVGSLTKMRHTELDFVGGHREYRDVPMLVSWQELGEDRDQIGYSFPEPLRQLMRRMPRYAYIELAAVGCGSMSSKFSAPLYRHLAMAMNASGVKWGPVPEDNVVAVDMTVEELAGVVGWSGKPVFTKLKDRVLTRIEKDFRNVRRFSVAWSAVAGEAQGRGRKPVVGIRFELTLNPPSISETRSVSAGGQRVGGVDRKSWRVNSHVWQRVANEFFEIVAGHKQAFDIWSLALQELESGEALSDGYETRTYRGESLREKLKTEGPDYAAWGFFEEELAAPDLVKRNDVSKLAKEAHAERLARAGVKPPKRETPKPGPRPAPIVFKPSAPAAAPAPEQAPLAEDGPATFQNCTSISIDLDEAVTTEHMESFVWQPLSEWCWNGDREINLWIRWYAKPGLMSKIRVPISPSAKDWERVLKVIGKYMDGVEEYSQ